MKKWMKRVGIAVVGLAIIGACANTEEETKETATEPVEEVESADTPKAEKEATAPVKEETPVEEPVKEEPKEEPAPTFSNPILDLDPATVAAEIKEKAEQDWPDDYMMMDFQVGEQTKAYEALKGYSIDSEVKQTQIERAMKDWPNDYMMMQFQYDEQMKAYNN
jgi:alkanesulfonate monooxygenase SsuD/methylene tetrahydromethanopterin reductase-like flavin-dependent oxidoreductase (luciferase family)